MALIGYLFINDLPNNLKLITLRAIFFFFRANTLLFFAKIEKIMLFKNLTRYLYANYITSRLMMRESIETFTITAIIKSTLRVYIKEFINVSHLEKAVSSIKDPLTKELAEYLLKDIPNRCYQELQEGYILRDIQSIRNHYAKSDENEFDIIINPPRISDGFFSVIITAFDLPFLVDSTLSCVARNQIEVFLHHIKE